MRYETLKQEATGTNKSILLLTSSETSSDFLFAPISKRRFRMYEAFKPYVQFYLGMPVTSERCTLGKCDDVRVIPNGDHAKHVGARVIGRHNLVRDGAGLYFKQLHTSGQSPLVCEFETFLSELGYSPKEDASDPSDARCDFVLRNPDSNRLVLADVRITHPNLSRDQVGEIPLVTANEAYKQKMDRYVKNYDITQSVIDTTGHGRNGGCGHSGKGNGDESDTITVIIHGRGRNGSRDATSGSTRSRGTTTHGT